MLDKGDADVTGKRFQITIAAFELHMTRQTLNPEVYDRYLSIIAKDRARFLYQRFEFYELLIPNGTQVYETTSLFPGNTLPPIFFIVFQRFVNTLVK